MRKLKLSRVNTRNRSGFIINFSQGNIYWALMTEFQVILDIGCIMNKICTQSSTTQPVLSPVLSQRFDIPSEPGLGWFMVQSKNEYHLHKALTGCSLQEELTPGYLAVPCLCCSGQSCKGKEEMGNLVYVGRRINWYNHVGRKFFIIKAKDAFTVLQCNNSTSPCVQETLPQMRKETCKMNVHWSVFYNRKIIGNNLNIHQPENG